MTTKQTPPAGELPPLVAHVLREVATVGHSVARDSTGALTMTKPTTPKGDAEREPQ